MRELTLSRFQWHRAIMAIIISSLTLLASGCNNNSVVTGQTVSKANEQAATTSPDERPNIIFVLVDDMGIGDAGPYGQKIIKTPNLDKMAQAGILFTQHYAGNTVCAPSRASLMTGLHTGHTQIRGNFELGGFTDDTEFGQMPLHPGTETIARVLQRSGYHTALIGKWGLGGPGSHGVPNKQGFDYFFGYLDQKQAHNHYPTHLWKNEEVFPLENKWLNPHASLAKGADPNQLASYEGFKRGDFAQQRLTNEALKYVSKRKDQPFFLYLAYAAPHAALQAPDEEVAKYSQIEEAGPYDGKENGKYLPVFKPRATRAAMISHIDEGLGRLLEKLHSLGLEKNTLVIFSSDNGPSWEGGADLDFFDSNGLSRGYKRDLYDGGIRVPTIAYWPGTIAGGQTTGHVSAFWDWMPTLAKVAGANPPRKTDGISLLPTLLGEGEQTRHESLYWEFHHWNGRHSQAIRIQDKVNGDWKGIRFFNGQEDIDPDILLYNLSRDPGETTNVAAQYPEVIKQAQRLFKRSRTRSYLDAWNFDYYAGKD